MKINFKIYPEKWLIASRFTGTIIFEDVLQWFNKTKEHPDFSPKYQGVIDMRTAVFGDANRENPGKMVKKTYALAEYMKKIDFTKSKWALITDTPVETSLLMMYAKDASKKHPIKIFSTVEAVEEYLNLSIADVLKDLNE